MSDEEWAAQGRTPRDESYWAAVNAAEKARSEVKERDAVDFDRYLPEHERAHFRILRAAGSDLTRIDVLLEWTYDKFERYYWLKIAEQKALSDSRDNG